MILTSPTDMHLAYGDSSHGQGWNEDFPDGYIARANVADNQGEMFGTTAYVTGDTLEEVRAQLPPGLTCFAASEDDQSRCIVESWM